MDINSQIEKVKEECYKLSQMLNNDKIRIEYNNNKKIKDKGKLEVMSILSKLN